MTVRRLIACILRPVAPLAVLVIALAAIVTGCSDAFSPEGVAGTYRLVSIWGHRLPYSLILDSYCEPIGRVSPGTFTYQSGSLTLSKQQTFVLVQDWTWAGDCIDESGTWTSAGPYSLTAPSTIRLSEDGGGVALEGTVTGDGITIVQPTPLVFER